MSELAGYYGGVSSVVCYILPWIVSIILAIMLYRIIQVKPFFNLLTCIDRVYQGHCHASKGSRVKKVNIVWRFKMGFC